MLVSEKNSEQYKHLDTEQGLAAKVQVHNWKQSNYNTTAEWEQPGWTVQEAKKDLDILTDCKCNYWWNVPEVKLM